MLQLGCKAVKSVSIGWGGALVGICPIDKIDGIVNALMNEYYLKYKDQLMVSDDLNMYVFKSLASAGAVVLDPTYEIWFA